MNENLEYQFINYQIEANNNIRSFLQNEITKLMMLIQDNRKIINQLDELDRKLNIRANQIGGENKLIVKYDL